MKKALYYLPFILFFQFNSFAQQNKVDSLQKKLENVGNDSIKCLILNELFESASEGNKLIYNAQLKTISENNLKNTPTVFYKKQFAISLNNFGAIYNDQGNIKKALDYCNESSELMEQIDDKKGVAQAFYQISEIYIGLMDYVKSYSYSKKSVKIMEEIGDKKGMADCSEDIGNYYEYHDKNFQKALECYQKGLKLSEQINYKKRAAYLQGNIARVYYQQSNFDEALKYNFKSLKTKEELGDKKGIGYSFAKIGNVYFKQGKTDLAFEYGQKSMTVAMELGYPDNIKRSADLLNLVYKKQGDYKKAYEMYQLSVTMRDSLNNMAIQKVALQNEYNNQKAIDKIEQDKKDIIAQDELRQQKIIIYSVSCGFILVLVLTFFIFRGYKQKQRANEIIAEKQKEILDSIHYAKRIQTALITSEKYIDKNLKKLTEGN